MDTNDIEASRLCRAVEARTLCLPLADRAYSVKVGDAAQRDRRLGEHDATGLWASINCTPGREELYTQPTSVTLLARFEMGLKHRIDIGLLALGYWASIRKGILGSASGIVSMTNDLHDDSELVTLGY